MGDHGVGRHNTGRLLHIKSSVCIQRKWCSNKLDEGSVGNATTMNKDEEMALVFTCMLS